MSITIERSTKLAKKKTEETQEPVSQRAGVMTTLMSIPGVADITRRFQESALTVELHAPDEATLALLTVDPQSIIKEAQEFKVGTDDDYRLAKQAADSLKDEADLIEAKRTGGEASGGTKQLTKLKATWDSLFNPGKNARESAATIYHTKMKAYKKKREDEDKRAREEQARVAREQREALERQAKEEEARAAKLKSPAKQEEALRKAAELRIGASMIPESFGESTTSVPSLGSGGEQKRWKGRVHDDDQEFAGWLLKNPEWRAKIVEYAQSGLNDLAKAVGPSNKQIPGFTAEEDTSYRREARKK